MRTDKDDDVDDEEMTVMRRKIPRWSAEDFAIVASFGCVQKKCDLYFPPNLESKVRRVLPIRTEQPRYHKYARVGVKV